MTTETVPPKTFSEVFLARVDDIEARAKKAGITITHVCRGSGIGRATPDRWRKEIPYTVALVDKMEAVVAQEEARQASDPQ